MLNTDEFRSEALKFQEYGYYCKYPSDTPQAKAYWNEQARRSIHGYKRDNGDWVTGYHYFYLNFCPIELTKAREDVSLTDKNVQGDRELDFPLFWDGDYDFFHYIEEGEKQGLFGDVDKVRGSGYSCKG